MTPISPKYSQESGLSSPGLGTSSLRREQLMKKAGLCFKPGVKRGRSYGR